MFLNNIFKLTLLCFALLLTACAAPTAVKPYTLLPLVERPSVNFGVRRPNYVILHHTSDDTAEESLRTLTDPVRQVSSHYLIGRDGKLYYLVDELARAWHAGEAYWGGNTDLNSSSIGIELDNNGTEPFAEPMIETLLLLLADLQARYRIPAANFLAHGDIIPGRKVDPSRHFPWQRLAARGFGLWCEPPYPLAPAAASDAFLLAAFGYDIANLNAALAAFKRRFVGIDSTSALTEPERALLTCLIQRKMER